LKFALLPLMRSLPPPCGLLLIKLQTYKFLGHTQVRAIRLTTKGFMPLPNIYAPSPPSWVTLPALVVTTPNHQ
jgi:hypothetical protein